jgi:hypothetical protein
LQPGGKASYETMSQTQTESCQGWDGRGGGGERDRETQWPATRDATSVADSGCLSRILIFTHPGSQIPDPGSKNRYKKERGEKKSFANSLHFPTKAHPPPPLYGDIVKFLLSSTGQVRARICKSYKEPRNRCSAWRAGTTTLFDVPARRAT